MPGRATIVIVTLRTHPCRKGQLPNLALWDQGAPPAAARARPLTLAGRGRIHRGTGRAPAPLRPAGRAARPRAGGCQRATAGDETTPHRPGRAIVQRPPHRVKAGKRALTRRDGR